MYFPLFPLSLVLCPVTSMHHPSLLIVPWIVCSGHDSHLVRKGSTWKEQIRETEDVHFSIPLFLSLEKDIVIC